MTVVQNYRIYQAVRRFEMEVQTEMLIEKVREHVCLYDTSHEAYKNVLKKPQIWNKIAGELHITSNLAKTKWKNLRDSYLEYKKAIKGITGQAKKYKKWPWSSYLEFLDRTLQSRPRSSNIVSASETEVQSTLEEEVPSRQLTEPNCDALEGSSPLNTPPLHRMPPPPESKSKKRPRCNNDVDKVISFLEKRTGDHLDGVDHLFLSYAQTFKKFPLRTQAVLKIELATLFGRTEMAELSSQQGTSQARYSENSSAISSPLSVYTERQMDSHSQQTIYTELNSPTVPEHLLSMRDGYESMSNDE